LGEAVDAARLAPTGVATQGCGGVTKYVSRLIPLIPAKAGIQP
jgi:hypothetical protein